MSIRIKLIITYMIMIIISAFILVTSGFGIVTSFLTNMTNIVMKDKHVDEVAYEVVDLLTDLKSTEKMEPELLLDKQYMEEVENRISEFSSTLIVRYKDQFMDVGQLGASEDFYQELLKKDPNNHTREDKIIQYQKATYFFLGYDFTYEENTITYYFIVDITEFKDTHKGYARGFFLFVLIFILLIVILPLTYILSRDIIQPLRKLEEGTHNIKEGNLDFKLEATSKNEIGRVIDSFDRMRYELKKNH